jgi:hypothetical protein
MVAGKRRFWVPAEPPTKTCLRAPGDVFDIGCWTLNAAPPGVATAGRRREDEIRSCEQGLAKGTGTAHPTASTVRVHYSGWTTKGEMLTAQWSKATARVPAQRRHQGLDRRRS